jgi:hypothetical protein
MEPRASPVVRVHTAEMREVGDGPTAYIGCIELGIYPLWAHMQLSIIHIR